MMHVYNPNRNFRTRHISILVHFKKIECDSQVRSIYHQLNNNMIPLIIWQLTDKWVTEEDDGSRRVMHPTTVGLRSPYGRRSEQASRNVKTQTHAKMNCNGGRAAFRL